MTLRRKTLMTVGGVFLGLVIILYFISQTLLLRSFTQLEEQRTRLDVERALNALSSDVNAMKTLTSDWAAWDDTYAFIENANRDYIRSNLVDSTFTTLQLNLMLFINPYGQMVYGKAFDLNNKEEVTIPQSLLGYLNPGSLLVKHSDPQGVVSGLILLPENPMLIVSYPILTSEGQGPIRGALIVGRYLNTAEITRIAEQTQLSLTAARYDRSPLPGDFGTVVPSLSFKTPVLVRPLDEHSIAGYALISDIYDKPILVLRVAMPRDIYAQGQTTAAIFILSLLGIGAVLGLVLILFLDKQVLSRLTRLSQGIGSIGKNGDLSIRVPVTREDELSNLGVAINVMVETLEKSSDLLKRKNQQLDAQNDDLINQRQALIEKTEEVEKATRLKSEFLANMSHELRTPLNVIIGFSELMIDEVPGKINSEQRQSLTDILTSSRHLLDLINEVLDLSRIESGRVEFKPGNVSLKELITSVTRSMMPILTARRQSLAVEIREELPPVYADEGKLGQVLRNLVDNASKYSPDGSQVKVEAAAKGNWCQVSVIDNGIGIRKEDMERIFEPFSRLTSPLAEKRGGTGLGLTVVKQIVERHGGRGLAESEYGKGSRFTFTVPLAKTASQTR